LLDVTAHDSFESVAEQVSSIVGAGGLNVLINNAAIMAEQSRTDTFCTDQMAESYNVNVISPTKLIKCLLPLLKAAGSSTNSIDFHISKASVVNISSDLGSISDPQIDHMKGLFLPYRCTKVFYIQIFCHIKFR
jgi:NAD(P)-dependent dehydrogenase (short-subunit alcohol dehydrogenase family)